MVEEMTETSTIQKDYKNKYGLEARHVQVAMMCTSLTFLFVSRSSIAVAVLAMTDKKRLNESNITIYDWDKKTQALILSSFFWGYTIMQIPGGMLAKRFGGKLVIFYILLINAFISAVQPTLAYVGGWKMVCVSRVVMGLSQGCLFPSIHTLLGRWLPNQERTKYTGIVYSGCHLGTIIGMPVSGLLAETRFGWKLIFYSMCGLLFLTAAVWYTLAASTPMEHRMMTPRELQYIQKGLNISDNQGPMRTPWREIFRTKAMWAILAAHCGCIISFVLFFVDTPTYLERGLGISLQNSATLSALPYIGMWAVSILSSLVSERIYNKGYLSLTVCRKVMNSIGLFGSGIGLVALAYLGPEQQVLAIATLVIALSFTGATSAGFVVNHLDLSPNYAGLLLSLTNFVANIGSVLTPIVTSFILRNNPHDVSRWRIVFLITAGICIVTNTVYVMFGSSQRQDWDDPNFLDMKKSDPEEMRSLKDKEDTKQTDAKQRWLNANDFQNPTETLNVNVK